jgi:hypothetical protein
MRKQLKGEDNVNRFPVGKQSHLRKKWSWEFNIKMDFMGLVMTRQAM